MERYEITGDWMVLTADEFCGLLKSARELTPGIICGNMRRPAVRKLNIELRFPDGGRDICAIEVFPSVEDADGAAMVQFFSAIGNMAVFEFATTFTLKGDEIALEGGFAPGRTQDRDKAEKLSFQYFFAFNVVQYVMLHGAEKVSFHKEYRKALKPARASQLVAPYTLPGKVRVLDISATADDVRDYVRRDNAVHTWHCPAWGVRGHYRHYKTGKVSYVKPYVKGKNKAAYAGREYALPEGAVIMEVMR